MSPVTVSAPRAQPTQWQEHHFLQSSWSSTPLPRDRGNAFSYRVPIRWDEWMILITQGHHLWPPIFSHPHIVLSFLTLIHCFPSCSILYKLYTPVSMLQPYHLIWGISLNSHGTAFTCRYLLICGLKYKIWPLTIIWTKAVPQQILPVVKTALYHKPSMITDYTMTPFPPLLYIFLLCSFPLCPFQFCSPWYKCIFSCPRKGNKTNTWHCNNKRQMESTKIICGGEWLWVGGVGTTLQS